MKIFQFFCFLLCLSLAQTAECAMVPAPSTQNERPMVFDKKQELVWEKFEVQTPPVPQKSKPAPIIERLKAKKTVKMARELFELALKKRKPPVNSVKQPQLDKLVQTGGIIMLISLVLFGLSALVLFFATSKSLNPVSQPDIGDVLLAILGIILMPIAFVAGLVLLIIGLFKSL